MSVPRSLSTEELAAISHLLRVKVENAHFADDLETLSVSEMADGGMGSLSLTPTGLENAERQFGRQIVSGEFLDSDGTPVVASIYVDRDNRLYELDVWKVNFGKLLQWPDPSSITISK